jgi:hypothetical protein
MATPPWSSFLTGVYVTPAAFAMRRKSTNLGAPTIRWASSIKLSHIPALFAQSESRTKS